MWAQVFALEPVQVELPGMDPQRVPKGTRTTIRSRRRIEELRVLPLHPVLSDTAYADLQRQRGTEQAGTLKVVTAPPSRRKDVAEPRRRCL